MILDDLGEYLQSKGFGTLGEDLFLQFKPDNLDCVVIFFTGGNPPITYLEQDKYTIQVRVINKNFSAGFQKINDIKKELHNKLLKFTNNAYCQAYTEISTWFEDERWNFVINFEILTKRV